MNTVAGGSSRDTKQYYALNDKQLEILHLLYRFRFGTIELLAECCGVSYQTMYGRVQTLYEQGSLDRRYKASDRLTHTPAVYSLGIEGRAALRLASPKYLPKVLRRYSRDKHASDGLVNRQLTLLRIYAAFNTRYGEDVNFFTASQLESYDYIPQPLPDAFIRIKVNDGEPERLYLMHLLQASQPFFVATRTIFNTIKFAEEELDVWSDNTGREMPRLLLACDSSALLKRLVKKCRRTVYSVNSNLLTIYLTTLDELLEHNTWHELVFPDEALPLHDIPLPEWEVE